MNTPGCSNDVEPTIEPTPPPAQQPLSRIQKRKNERLRQEVDEVYRSLTSQFLELFTLSDNPEGQHIQDKAKQVAAQWRTYCRAKQLIPTLHGAMDNYLDALMRDYLTSKENNIRVEKIDSQGVGVPESLEP